MFKHSVSYPSILLIGLVTAFVVGEARVFGQQQESGSWSGPDYAWQAQTSKYVGVPGDVERHSPKKLGVDPTGGYNLVIPLISVPGRNGFNFDLTLNYRPGIKVMQEASWVGLGWNLEVGSITRNVVVRCDRAVTQAFSGAWENSWDELRDSFSISCPVGNGTMLQFPQSGNPGYFDLMLEEWRDWKITYDNTKHRFVVVVEDGTTYVFGLGGVGLSSNILKIYVGEHLQVPFPYEPYMQWFLTAILSADYVDGGGDALNPIDSTTPAVDNKGSWIAVEWDYNMAALGSTDHKKWFYYYTQKGGSQEVSLYEVTYPYRIVTPTHVAVFNTEVEGANILSFKQDATYSPGGTGIWQPDVGEDNEELKRRLKDIKLYRYSGSGSDPVAGNPIQEVVFSYDNQLESRTTLKEVQIKGGAQSLPPYKMEYFHPVPIPPDYNTIHAGDPAKYGRVGFWGWYNGKPGYDNYTSFDGLPSDGEAWNLKKITYPSGGYIQFGYESDKQPSDILSSGGPDLYRGGSRVTSQLINDGINPQQTLSYSYSSCYLDGTEKQGAGRPYISPLAYFTWFFAEDYYEDIRGGDLGYVLELVMDRENEYTIYYEEITEVQSDNSKTISYYSVRKYDDNLGFPQGSTDPATVYQKTLKNRGFLVKREYYNAAGGKVKEEVFTKGENIKATRTVDASNYPVYMSVGMSQDIITTTNCEQNGNIVTTTTLDYNNLNGLIKKKTETNSDETKRITKFKYPVDYTNTTGTGDVYEQAIHAMRMTKHIHSPVIEKEIREQPSGQSEKVIAAELVRYKLFNTSQYLPHEIKRFSNPTSVTNFVESSISSGTLASDSRYQLAATNAAYDIYGNLTETKDAKTTPTSTTTIWAYNNTLPVGQIRNATSSQATVSVFDDNNTSGWSGTNGTWTISNGAYQQTNTTITTTWDNPKYYSSLSLDDGILEADVRFDETTTPKFIAISKWVNATNFVRFELRRESSNPVVRIHAKKGTANSTLDVGKTFTAYQWYHLRGEIQGSTAKLYLDGELLVTLTNTNVDHGNGSIGLCTYATAGSFDNVRHYPPAALASSTSYDVGFFKPNVQSDENGNSRFYMYDSFGRLQSVTDASGRVVQERSYFYSNPFSSSNPNYVQTTVSTHFNQHVRNYDFEDGGGSQPNYWIGEIFGSGCTADWDNTVSFSSAKSIKAKIPNLGPSNRVRWMVSPWYDEMVSPKVTYRMEVWVKTADGYNGNAKFILYFHNAAHAVTETPTITVPSGDREWTRYSLDFTPLLATDHLYAIYLDFQSTNQYKGTVWYDRANFYELNTTKTFADGLGRDIQTAQYEGTGSNKIATIYDALGRVQKVTKAFPSSSQTYSTGAVPSEAMAFYNPNPINTTNANNHPVYFYGATPTYQAPDYDIGDYPYSETVYNSDPLNRVYRQIPPGTDYRSGANPLKYVEFQYLSNTLNELDTYAENSLFKQRQKDENDNYVDTFADLFGNNVGAIVDPTGSTPLKTVLKYDVLGNLVEVKDPKQLTTTYAYNTLSQLRQKITPDAGTVEYLYDKNSNLRFVKDAKGAAPTGNYFIYYKYDNLNRKTEEGTVTGTANFTQANADNISYPTSADFKVKYHYDFPGYTTSATQRNLSGRLEAIEYVTDRYTVHGYIFYSYDNSGNIEWIAQHIPKGNVNDGTQAISTKIDYQYDALGKISKMYFHRSFPPGASSDVFYVWFEYDALARLEKVFTNTSDVKPITPDAKYTYWPTSQVKRIVLGGSVQGVDYLYNSRDWLSQINHQNLVGSQDPGGDGGSGGVVNGDRFGQIIGYNRLNHIAYQHTDADDQFSGNISWIIHNTQSLGLSGWVYRYDSANRLIKANWGYFTSQWLGTTVGESSTLPKYDVAGSGTAPNNLIQYEANGNLDYMIRYDQNNAPTNMDYVYPTTNNKLDRVSGLNGQATSTNYTYDGNGNMITDVRKLANGASITYDYRNLPTQVPMPSGTIYYGYDGNGQRIFKNNLFYVPGADGKVIAVYDINGTHLYWNVWGLDLIGQRFWAQ